MGARNQDLRRFARSVWRLTRQAIRGRLVLFAAAFSIGLFIPTVAFQRPELFRSEHAADWSSASASFIAAVVALGLGLYAVRQDGRRERERSHGAALVFLNNVTETLAFLETIEDNKNDVSASATVAAHLNKQLMEFPALLPTETLQFLPYLPPGTAKLIVICAQRISSTKQRLAIAHSHADQATQLFRTRDFLFVSFLPLGNQLFSQIFGAGSEPPWRDPNRPIKTK